MQKLEENKFEFRKKGNERYVLQFNNTVDNHLDAMTEDFQKISKLVNDKAAKALANMKES